MVNNIHTANLIIGYMREEHKARFNKFNIWDREMVQLICFSERANPETVLEIMHHKLKPIQTEVQNGNI